MDINTVLIARCLFHSIQLTHSASNSRNHSSFLIIVELGSFFRRLNTHNAVASHTVSLLTFFVRFVCAQFSSTCEITRFYIDSD